MEIGIIGLPCSGKSTLFEAMTGFHSRNLYGETCVRSQATVPDRRFECLVDIFKPRKVSPAQIPFIDCHANGNKTLEGIRQAMSRADAYLHVVDAFSTQDSNEVRTRYRKEADELILSDLMVVEKRMEKLDRLPKRSFQPIDAQQLATLPLIKAHLEAGFPLRSYSLTPDEQSALRGFSFWTIRPELIVINTNENDDTMVYGLDDAIENTPVLAVSGEIEAEIAAMPFEVRQEYLTAMGIEEPALHRIIRSAFGLTGRITYFTVGEDEVKAWVISRGSTAPQAAAAIHQDLERGFIRAEVVSYKDFIAYGKSYAGAKAAGKIHLEGKEYCVEDGDIINFRFNI